MAQLVEQRIRNAWVAGSSPAGSFFVYLLLLFEYGGNIMAFWDQVKDTVSKSSKTVSEKTKQFTTIAKLNVSISNEESSLKEAYMNIGRKYYELHKEDLNSPYYEELQAIRQGLDRIHNYKEQIKELKGMSFCSNCGENIPKDSRFCNHCGFQNKQQETACDVENNTQVQGEVIHFGEMQENVYQNTSSQDDIFDTVIIPEDSGEEGINHICSVCHQPLPKDASFCGNCGTPQ